jgi:RNA polymerase sigma-70 factor (ECF subfamily)
VARSTASSRRLRVVPGDGRQAEARAAAAGLDDAQLVALARASDVGAFEALYRRHVGFALNLAVRIQGSASDAEGIVHDAFLRAHQRLRELRDGHLFRAWLGSIVVRFVRTRLRRGRLMALLGVRGAQPVDLDALAAPDASPEARAELAQVYALLQTMSPQDRIAWTLRHIERHRLEAVAELSGCSLATAKRRIHRAQEYLRAHFVAPFEQDESQ